MVIKKDGMRMILRYGLAGLLASLSVFLMHEYWDSHFDNVASVVLFSSIIAITGEDVSLGPVLFKSIFRTVGVCIGGCSGFILLLFPTAVFPNSKTACLLVIPCVFVSTVQYICNGGSTYITALLKKNKAKYLTVQMQIGFGTVYFGSWDAPTDGLSIAIVRTGAIFLGVILLLISSLVVYPDTSLHASASELCVCLETCGQLLISSCKNRVGGVALPPYNHKARVFGWDVSEAPIDAHMKCLQTIDDKTARVAALQPYLCIEPTWVPGQPMFLTRSSRRMARHFGGYYGVVNSRIQRMRSTMTVLDSNIRIDGANNRRFKEHIGVKLLELSAACQESLCIVARFISSRFEELSVSAAGAGMEAPAKGAIGLKVDMIAQIDLIRRLIREFVDIMHVEIESSNHVRITDDGVADSTVLGDRSSDSPVAFPSVELPTRDTCPPPDQADCGIGLGLGFGIGRGGDFGIGIGARAESANSRKQIMSFKNVPLSYMGAKVGDTMKSWYKLHPMRVFGALLVQCAMQIASLLRDSVTFMDSLAAFDSPTEDVADFGESGCCCAPPPPVCCSICGDDYCSAASTGICDAFGLDCCVFMNPFVPCHTEAVGGAEGRVARTEDIAELPVADAQSGDGPIVATVTSITGLVAELV
jgi:hypothetical protein